MALRANEDETSPCRVLRLTLLTPTLVEAILDGRQPEGMTLPALMEGVTVVWGATRVLTEAPSP